MPLIPTTTNPRRETCSLLIVADYKSGRCEEVEEGFVGWLKVDQPSVVAGGEKAVGATKGGEKDKGEMKVQGVRFCRECWAVVS